MYDNPTDVYAEQSALLPRGPLGLLEPPDVTAVTGLPPEAVEVVSAYLRGELGSLETVARLEHVRKSPTKRAVPLVP